MRKTLMTLMFAAALAGGPLEAACPNCDIYQGGNFMNGLGPLQGPGLGWASWVGNAGAAAVFVNVVGGTVVSGFVPRGPRGEGKLAFPDPGALPVDESFMHLHFNAFDGAAAVAMTVMDYEFAGRKVKLEVFGPGHANAGQVLATYSTASGVISTLYNYGYTYNPTNDEDAPGSGSIPYDPSRLSLKFSACGLRLQVGVGAEPALTAPGVDLPGFAPHASVTGSHLVFGNNNTLGAPLDGWFDDIRIWTCANTATATPTPTRTPSASPTSTACADCGSFDGVHGFNMFNLQTQYGGVGLGNGAWIGGAGAAPVYVQEDSGHTVSGFVPRGGRAEGRLSYAADMWDASASFVSLWFQVHSGASASEMAILDLNRGGRRVRLSVFGPGHANYGQLKVTYSTPSGLQSDLLPWAYGSGGYNDQSVGGGAFSPARWVVALSIDGCGLEVLPGYLEPGTKFQGSAPGSRSYPAYGPHGSVAAQELAFGNDVAMGAALDGYIDDIRIYRCPSWVAPSTTPSSTVTPTATPTLTAVATATPTAGAPTLVPTLAAGYSCTPCETRSGWNPIAAAVAGSGDLTTIMVELESPTWAPYTWGGGPSAKPVSIDDGYGWSLSGFIPRGGRSEGWLSLPGSALRGEAGIRMKYAIHVSATASEMGLFDWQDQGYAVKVTAFGPGHVDHGRLKVTYSNGTGYSSRMIGHIWAPTFQLYQTGPLNDLDEWPGFDIHPDGYGESAITGVSVSMGACGLMLNYNADWTSTAVTFQLPGYAANAPGASYLVLGNQFGGGMPIDGWIDNPEQFQCAAPTATPSATAGSPTRTVTTSPTRTGTATPSVTPTATPSLTAAPGSPTASRTPTATRTVTPTATPSTTAAPGSPTATRTATAVPGLPTGTATPTSVATLVTPQATPTKVKRDDKRVTCHPNQVRGRGQVMKILARSYAGGSCSLKVNRPSGRVLADLWHGYLAPQEVKAQDWDTSDSQGSQAPSGVYYVVFTDGDGSIQVQKVLIVR